ncbi:MAG TPA: glycosyltransferase family 39 protein, partial [Vicinamibacterales bacterium]|nr:glycosyltransferase family 39 protein [Vicinamibacterales bacterium]
MITYRGRLAMNHPDFTSTARVLGGVSLLCVPVIALGWHFGYHSIGAYIVFWLFSASVGVTATVVARRTFPWHGLVGAVIRAATIAFAIVVLTGLILGSLGQLTAIAVGVLLTAVCALSRLLLPPRSGATTPRVPDVPIAVVAAVSTIFIFIVSYGIGHSPLTAYDSLSYHLFFPARWLQEHRLSIIATPFSDEAQAYAPVNGELYFLWLMLPFHGDLLARIGQVPFYLLSGVVLFALARRIGAKPEHAAYPAAFCFLSKPIVDQAVGANVDLICWAMFLSALYLGIAAVDSDERRDWILWGVAVGLCLGSKFVALVYMPVLALLPFIRGFRMKALWALPGVAMFALPWYLRNWIVAGSPIFPASVTFAGITIAQGAFTRNALLNSVFHTTDFRLFPVLASRAFGSALSLVWLPFAALGAWSLVKREHRWPGMYVLLVPFLMAPLFWFGVPDNIDHRFLLPAALVALVPTAFVFRTNRIWNAALHALYAAAMAWLVVGADATIPVRNLPWPMGDGLYLEALANRRYLVLFLFVASVMIAAWMVSKKTRFTLPALAVVSVAATTVLAVGSEPWCGSSQCDFLRIAPTYIRPAMLDGWDWVERNTHDATFAYAGNNVPYPLVGTQMTNRVYYVNIDHHLTWKLHDYARAVRKRQGTVTGLPALAISSGELRPAERTPGGGVDASRPRYERMDGYREAWIGNLKQLGVDHLFVSTLSADEVSYVWHNERGFPIEDEWAKADPKAF